MLKIFCLFICSWLAFVSCSDFIDLYRIHKRAIDSFERNVDRLHDLMDSVEASKDLIMRFDENIDKLLGDDYVSNFAEIQHLFKWKNAIVERRDEDMQELTGIRIYLEMLTKYQLQVVIQYHRDLQESLMEKYRLAGRKHDLKRILLLRDRMYDSTQYFKMAKDLLKSRSSGSLSRISQYI